MRPIFLLTLGLLGLAGQLHGQRLQPSFPSIDSEELHQGITTRPAPSIQVGPAWLVAGGVVGGAVGLFGGALLGGRLTEDDCEDCGLVGAVYGGIAGGSALLPLGVHLANGRRGNFGMSLLASLAIGAAGFGLSAATEEWGIMLAVPVAQIVSSIAIERGTTR